MLTYGSLYPWHFRAVHLPASPLWILFHSWPPHIDIFVVRDVVVNIAIYVPAGLTGHLAFRKFGRFWLSLTAPVLIGTVLSASIEMIQLFVPGRNTNCLDLLTNVFGSLLGVVLAASLEEIIQLRSAGSASQARRKPADRSALVMLVCWVAWLWFPLIPIFGRTMLRNKFGAFLSAPWNSVQFISAAMLWFAAGTLFLASSIRPARWLPLIASLLVIGQFLIAGQQPSRAGLAGALAGSILWMLLWPKRKLWRDGYRRIQAWAFVLVLLIRGLSPFTFSSSIINQFSWLPFGGFLNTEWQDGVRLVLEKFFWYGLAFWLLKKSGMRPWIAASLVAIVLLSVEIAQTRLPGRTSEITDPLLALFAAGVLTALSRGSQPVEP